MHIEVKAGYGQNPSVATMGIKRIFQVCGILPLPSTALAFLEACVVTEHWQMPAHQNGSIVSLGVACLKEY